jgi:26S proteasome regulatory subunit N6
VKQFKHNKIPIYHNTMAPVDSQRILDAQKAQKSDPRQAETIYKDILSKTPSATNDAAVREYETALVRLGELYRDERYDRLKSPFETHVLTYQ